MSSPGPARQSSDLADMVEMLLDKGVVINADIAVSVGDTQLLGIHVRAALASFETAAQYGLAFPEGTDEERIAEITGAKSPHTIGATGGESDDQTAADLDAPEDDARTQRSAVAPRPSGSRPGAPGSDDESEDDDGDDSGADDGDDATADDANDESEEEAAPEATTDVASADEGGES